MAGLLSRVRVTELETTRRGRRPVPPGIVVAALYCILSVLAYRPIFPIDSGAIPGGTAGDPLQAIWYLAWIPFALFHGHNPFVTNFLDYPGGVNLATNTLAAPLGLVAAPVTLAMGPLAAYNMLLRLALASSATSMCLVLRSWTRWWPAAFAGGLLYGFGSYMNEQGQWHLSLAFVPLPPLIFWCLSELLVRQRRSPRTMGILLGLLCAAQFLIHPEVLADCALIAAVGVLALALAYRHEVIGRASRVLPALGWAAACFGIICAYPMWLLFAGPRHLTGPVAPVWFISQDHTDLLGLIRRNIVIHLVTANGSPYVSHGVQLTSVNNTDYLGFPLAGLITILAITQWRSLIVRVAALLAFVSFVFSLGQHLTVNGSNTGIPLPPAALVHVPMLDDVVWYRWSLFMMLFACIVLGVGLDRSFNYVRRLASRSQIGSMRAGPRVPLPSLPPLAPASPRFVAPGALCAAVVAAFIPLASPYPLTSKQVPWPGRLLSSLRQAVPAGGVVLALPYVTSATDEPMAWQAIDQMRFRIVGGYATVPDGSGNGSFHVSPSKTLTLLDLAAVAATAGKLTRSTSGAPAMAAHACEVVPEVLKDYSVDALVVWPTGIYQSLVSDLLKPVLGTPSRQFGQALVWYNVRRELTQNPRCGSALLPRGTAADGYWRPFSANCWTVPASFGTLTRIQTVPGRGAATTFTVVRGRRYYTFAEIRPTKPLNWRHRRSIQVSYRGTGSRRVYQIYFELAPNEVARYALADNSEGWHEVSLPTAQRGIPPAAWSHLTEVGLALSPKTAAGTLAVSCPVPSSRKQDRGQPMPRPRR